MRYKEFIIATAQKIVAAANAGNYEIKQVDTKKLLNEDDAIEATAYFIKQNNKIPRIKQVRGNTYRIQAK